MPRSTPPFARLQAGVGCEPEARALKVRPARARVLNEEYNQADWSRPGSPSSSDDDAPSNSPPGASDGASIRSGSSAADGDVCIIIASSSVWGALSSKQAVALASRSLFAANAGRNVTHKAHRELKARDGDVCQDMTAVVIFLPFFDAPAGAPPARRPATKRQAAALLSRRQPRGARSPGARWQVISSVTSSLVSSPTGTPERRPSYQASTADQASAHRSTTASCPPPCPLRS